MATTSTSSTAVAQAVFAAFNAHDTSALRELWGPGITERLPDATVSGADDLTAYFQGLFDAIPDVRMETVDLIAEGDTVVGRFTCSGTHLGDWLGHAPTGRRFEAVAEVYVFRFREGRIVHAWGLEDTLGRLEQLGLR